MQTRTFLFSDLRDYTRFVQQHGDAAAAALIGDYRRLVRAEVARLEGAEVKTEGDSFYVVFSSAQAALRCGTAILREAERYSAERPDRAMRVGVGVHAGEPQPHEGQFVGGAVIVAARLAQAAEAGQLLTTEIVRGLLPGGAGPRMEEVLGISLKGIDRAPRVLSVAWRTAGPTPAPEDPGVAVPGRPPEDGLIVARELIGREAELAGLITFLDQAAEGRGRLVLVAGEAGLGKSALVARFLEQARNRATVLVGECTEIEARRPFGPIVDAFEAASFSLPREFGTVGPGALGSVETDRYRVHAAFVQQLRERAATAPLVLVIEDAHWADHATLELLEYLPRQIRSARILVVATYRSDELHRRHPLNDTLAELERGRLSSELRLRPLDEDGTARLVTSALRLDRAPTAEFRAAIHERCGGNPFFTEEVLRALMQRGDLAYEKGSWRRTRSVAQIELPRTISAAVDQRLRELSERSLGILRTAAVVGTRFDIGLLADVSEATDDALVTALREAVDAQLIVEERDAPGETYRFRHALTRESVVSELLGRERRSLHRRIALALESRAGGAAEGQAEALAYHFDEAGDAEKTIVYRRLAAAQASRAVAFGRAQEHLDRAVELAQPDRADLPDLYLELGEAARYAGDLPRALAAVEASARLAEERGDARRSGAALSLLGTLLLNHGDRQRAGGCLDRALEVLGPLGATRELARAYYRRAYFSLLSFAADAAKLADHAVELGRRTGDVEAVARGLTMSGTARGAPDGVPSLRESFELAARHDLVSAAHSALNNLHYILVLGGSPPREVWQVRGELLAYGRMIGYRNDLSLGHELDVAREAGDWDAALRLIDDGRGTSANAAGRELWEALILVARSGPAAGLDLLAAPHAELAGSGFPQFVRTATFSAFVRYIGGDLPGAVSDARPLLDLPPLPATDDPLIAAMLAADELGDEAARDAYVRRALAEPALGRRVCVVRFAEGLVAERSGEAAAALAKYEEGAQVAEEWKDWLAVTFIRCRRAGLLAVAGDLAAARAEFDRFLPYWRTAKATWYLGELEQKAHAMGVEVVTG